MANVNPATVQNLGGGTLYRPDIPVAADMLKIFATGVTAEAARKQMMLKHKLQMEQATAKDRMLRPYYDSVIKKNLAEADRLQVDADLYRDAIDVNSARMDGKQQQPKQKQGDAPWTERFVPAGGTTGTRVGQALAMTSNPFSPARYRQMWSQRPGVQATQAQTQAQAVQGGKAENFVARLRTPQARQELARILDDPNSEDYNELIAVMRTNGIDPAKVQELLRR